MEKIVKIFKVSRVVNRKRAMYESNHKNMPLNFGNSDLVINLYRDINALANDPFEILSDDIKG
ncbi:577_t:CDS:2 [Funneliformis geosporum]|nr:577_t:CDS:2 [Funneliformis geosporum]